MKTLFPIRGFVLGMAARSVCRWLMGALAWPVCCCSAGGAEVGALRFDGATQYAEIPAGETVTIDDQGPRFKNEPGAAWTAASATNAFQGGSIQTSDPQATARWTPLLSRAGTYRVYAFWGGAPTPLDPAAEYVVKHAAGFSTNVVNQNTNGGQWAFLGTFNFAASREEFVTMRSSGAGAAVADAMRFVNDQAFDLTRSLTLEAWVKLAAIDQPWQAVITKGEAWGLACAQDRVVFRSSDASGTIHDLVSSEPVAPGRWYHLATTFEGASKLLYINGKVAGSAHWPARLSTNQHPVWFGGSAETPSSNHFGGELENVRIWSLARSQNELQGCTNRHLRGTETGLLGDWRFDDLTGTNLVAFDSSAGALHALLRESDSPPLPSAGLSFGLPLPGPLALRFNGHDQYIALPVPSDGRFDLADAGTIETWIYFDFLPAERVGLVSKGTAAGWELALEPTGKCLLRTAGLTGPDPANPATQVTADLPSRTRLEPGKWNHVAASWSRSAGRKALFLNGVLDASVEGLQGAVAASPEPVHFAARPNANDRSGFFEGTLDEIRLWSVAREQPQINENFGRDLNGVEPRLTGFWKFDEGSGLTTTDQGPGEPKMNGLLAGMTDFNRVPGRTLSSALLLQYSLRLNGQDEYVEVSNSSIIALTNLTIEAWVKPSGTNFKTVLQKGDYGYGLAIDEAGYLRFTSTLPVRNWPRSTRPLALEQDAEGNPVLDAQGLPVTAWNHVGVVVDGAAKTTTFYINGQAAGTSRSSLVVNNTGPLFIGRGWTPDGPVYFPGSIDEVRLWNVSRSGVEVDLFAFTQLLGTTPLGLIGYWTFNEGQGTTVSDRSGRAHDGNLVNTDLTNWQDGTDWGLPPLPGGLGGLNPNPGAVGLWMGQVQLDKVSEVQAATQGSAEAATAAPYAANIRILLHVSKDGQVRLLKDVTVMKRASADNTATNSGANPQPPVVLLAPGTNLVLITRPELIPNYQGVMRRGGKLVGLRYGTAAYDFQGTVLPVLGGVGPGATCLGRINLSKDHPTNPYRHKYHPDHRSGFNLVRQFTLTFDPDPGDSLQEAPGYGVDHLTGFYRETVVGLHKLPLHVAGTVRLERIASVGILDDGQ